MIIKRIEVSGKNITVVFENYYHLSVNKENTLCRIIIPRYAILEKKSTKETKDVESESYISVGDNVNVCLSGDIELNINCIVHEMNNITDRQLEILCKIIN